MNEQSRAAKVKALSPAPAIEGEPDWKWCAPGDRQGEPVWILKFDDSDVPDHTYRSEEEGLAAYRKYSMSWNVYLFALVPHERLRRPSPACPHGKPADVRCFECSPLGYGPSPDSATPPTLPPLSDRSHHFTDEQVMAAVVGTDYIAQKIRYRLNMMTSGEKFTLYRAIKKLITVAPIEDSDEDEEPPSQADVDRVMKWASCHECGSQLVPMCPKCQPTAESATPVINNDEPQPLEAK